METNFPLRDYNFQKARLLIVEDNDDMWIITRVALRKEFPELQLDRVSTCQQALAYLSTCIEEDHPLPKLILQDLYIPDRKEGLHLLRAIREKLAMDAWPQLPIVVTSSSADPNDIQACYQHGASSYIVKPSSPGTLSSVFQAVRQFWWETSVLPLT